MLRSPFRPEANSHAVAPLTRMPNAATTTIVRPAGCGGAKKRVTASQAIAPVTSSSTTPLPSAARIDERRSP